MSRLVATCTLRYASPLLTHAYGVNHVIVRVKERNGAIKVGDDNLLAVLVLCLVGAKEGGVCGGRHGGSERVVVLVLGG